MPNSHSIHRRAGSFAILVATLVVLAFAGCDFGVPWLERPAPQFGCFLIQDPYATPGRWHRGNFHMHSSHSDGALVSAKLVDLYQRNGYTVLCISDHNGNGDQDGGALPDYQVDDEVHDWNGDGVLHPDRVVGSGVEAYVRDYDDPGPAWSRDRYVRPSLQWDDAPVLIGGAEMSRAGGWHFGVVGLPGGWLEPPGMEGYIERAHAAGGFVFLAHPGEWNPYPDRLASLVDIGSLDAIEIMNGLRLTEQARRGVTPKSPAAPAADRSGDACMAALPPDATPLWDALLARGFRLWAIANDDTHSWQGCEIAPPFTAFNMLLTADPTRDGFLAALHAGSFYSSTGLYFLELGARGKTIVALAPGALRLRFVGWGGQVLLETDGERGAYTPDGTEGYVRVEAEGANVAGRPWAARAWSQPFFLETAPCDDGSGRNLERTENRD